MKHLLANTLQGLLNSWARTNDPKVLEAYRDREARAEELEELMATKKNHGFYLGFHAGFQEAICQLIGADRWDPAKADQFFEELKDGITQTVTVAGAAFTVTAHQCGDRLVYRVEED